MELLNALNWRYATKKMNGNTVSEEDINTIVKAAHLAPTSSGLQPFEVLVITDQELREKIRPIAFDQSQITDCSHLLVFAAWDNYTPERINNMFLHTTTERGLPADTMNDYKNRLLSMYGQRSADENFEHAARQAYIAFGIAIAAAAELKIDTTPMEGFNAPELDALLNLSERGLRSVTLLPVGYRDELNDWLFPLKKVRKPYTDFVTTL